MLERPSKTSWKLGLTNGETNVRSFPKTKAAGAACIFGA
jgi:hypothetical protein